MDHRLSLLLTMLAAVDEIDLPSPEIDQYEGDLLLDWLADNRVRLTVGLQPNGEIYWSALIDDFRDHGRTLDTLDKRFRDVLCRYRDASERVELEQRA